MNYSNEARELDAEIFTRIERWHKFGEAIPDDAFNALALRIFAHQLRYDEPYAKYCAALGVTLERMPQSWEAIPAVPSAAFKEAALATFPPTQAELTFATSGTTGNASGYHYMESARLYDAALLAGFDRFMLPDHIALRYLNLVPNPAQHPQLIARLHDGARE